MFIGYLMCCFSIIQTRIWSTSSILVQPESLDVFTTIGSKSYYGISSSILNATKPSHTLRFTREQEYHKFRKVEIGHSG